MRDSVPILVSGLSLHAGWRNPAGIDHTSTAYRTYTAGPPQPTSSTGKLRVTTRNMNLGIGVLSSTFDGKINNSQTSSKLEQI